MLSEPGRRRRAWVLLMAAAFCAAVFGDFSSSAAFTASTRTKLATTSAAVPAAPPVQCQGQTSRLNSSQVGFQFDCGATTGVSGFDIRANRNLRSVVDPQGVFGCSQQRATAFSCSDEHSGIPDEGSGVVTVNGPVCGPVDNLVLQMSAFIYVGPEANQEEVGFALSGPCSGPPPRCRASALRLELLETSSASGHRRATFWFVNEGRLCHLWGYPGVGLLDARGRPIRLNVARMRGSRTHEVQLLKHGAAYFTFAYEAGAFCSGHSPVMSAIRVFPPGARRSLRLGLSRQRVCTTRPSAPRVGPVRANFTPPTPSV